MEETVKKDSKKIGLKKFLRSFFGNLHFTKETWFPIFGGLFAIIMFIFIAVMIRFLGFNLQSAFTPIVPQGNALQFDMEGYEKLNLEKHP